VTAVDFFVILVTFLLDQCFSHQQAVFALRPVASNIMSSPVQRLKNEIWRF